jgi:phosphoribosyl-dephospho-CoA transferase
MRCCAFEMPPDLITHTLLRIRGAQCLIAQPQPPAWVSQALERAPWVVIRRASAEGAAIPVGVRGEARHQRFAAWLPTGAILERVTPQALVLQHAWASAPRRTSLAALVALDGIEQVMRSHELHARWGPTGSVGFELASAYPSTRAESDLDLAVQLDQLPSAVLARSLHAQLAAVGTAATAASRQHRGPQELRIDVLLELPQGAVALAEYAQLQESFVLRTADGPRLISGLPDASAREGQGPATSCPAASTQALRVGPGAATRSARACERLAPKGVPG